MVSLGKVEAEAAALWPENQHAVIAVPDARKGEQLILITDRPNTSRDELQTYFRAHNLPELMLPKTIIFRERLPLLGTGKTDYAALKSLADKEAAVTA